MAERKGSDDNAWTIAEAESRILAELRGWIRTNQERITRETRRLRLLLAAGGALIVLLTVGVSYLSFARTRGQLQQTRSDVLEAAADAKEQVSAAARTAAAMQHDIETRAGQFDELIGRLEAKERALDLLIRRAESLGHASGDPPGVAPNASQTNRRVQTSPSERGRNAPQP